MKFSAIILGEFWFKLLNNFVKQSKLYYFIALTLYDANAKDPCKGTARQFALNGANCAKKAIDKLRDHYPHLRTDPRTAAIEDCVFTNVGGGFASGGTVGAGIGAAMGASVRSIGGAVATAVDYCCDRHGCHHRKFWNRTIKKYAGISELRPYWNFWNKKHKIHDVLI